MDNTKEKAIELLEDLDTEVYNEDSDRYTYHLAIEMAVEALKQLERRDCGWTGVDDDYPVSIREVIDITAETGALTTQSRVMELKPYKQPERKTGYWEITDAYPHNVYCSECHKKFAQTHWSVWEDGSLPRNFCPNCGSPMEVEYETD